MSTALVLARPERRRMLAELLCRRATWSASDRARYAELIQREYVDICATFGDDAALAAMQERYFGDRVGAGVAVSTALAESRELSLREFGFDRTQGQVERERRRRLREAVTAIDAREVVTLAGRQAACLVCGQPLPPWGREDRTYCRGGRCKQRAYRMRARGSS